MRELCFFVPLRFPSLNELIYASRSSAYEGSRMKREYTRGTALIAATEARKQGWKAPACPVSLDLTWVEKDKRRDQDNVTSGQKYLLDGIVEAGVLKGDSQRWIPQPSRNGIKFDKQRPGVWVRIKVLEETNDQ